MSEYAQLMRDIVQSSRTRRHTKREVAGLSEAELRAELRVRHCNAEGPIEALRDRLLRARIYADEPGIAGIPWFSDDNASVQSERESDDASSDLASKDEAADRTIINASRTRQNAPTDNHSPDASDIEARLAREIEEPEQRERDQLACEKERAERECERLEDERAESARRECEREENARIERENLEREREENARREREKLQCEREERACRERELLEREREERARREYEEEKREQEERERLAREEENARRVRAMARQLIAAQAVQMSGRNIRESEVNRDAPSALNEAEREELVRLTRERLNYERSQEEKRARSEASTEINSRRDLAPQGPPRPGAGADAPTSSTPLLAGGLARGHKVFFESSSAPPGDFANLPDITGDDELSVLSDATDHRSFTTAQQILSTSTRDAENTRRGARRGRRATGKARVNLERREIRNHLAERQRARLTL